MLALQHCLLPQTVLSHLRKYCLQMILLPDHRRPSVRPFTITHFIDRIGRESFRQIFDGLNDKLLRMGLLSPKMYVDSRFVKANVSSYGLAPSGIIVQEFRQQAIEENGLFTVTETTVAGDTSGRQ